MRELVASVSIKDCEVQTFRAGGPGGQKQNKTNSGVRVIHHPSGARGESREERSQLQNKKKAFLRMIETPAFKLWVKKITALDDLARCAVDRDTWPDRVRIEVRKDGEWVDGIL